MKSSLAQRDHVERHHSTEHAPPRQSLAQHRQIADAVLQADDHGIGGSMLCDDIGDLGRICAFHRHQHHAGIGKNAGVFGQRQFVGCNGAIKSLKTRQPQAVGCDLLDHPRACQQCDAAAGGRKHAADKAADAAGACHADRSVRNHPAALPRGTR
jgi:hypothetical protein